MPMRVNCWNSSHINGFLSNSSIHKKVCTKFSQSLNSFKVRNWGHTNWNLWFLTVSFFQFHFFNFISQFSGGSGVWIAICFPFMFQNHSNMPLSVLLLLKPLLKMFLFLIFSGFYRSWICNLCFLYVSKYRGHVRYNMVCPSLLPLVYWSGFHRKFLLWSSFGLGRWLRLG